MNMLALYLLTSVFVSLIFGGYIQSKANSLYIKMFLPLSVIFAEYLIGYLLQLMATTEASALFWMYFQSISSPFVAAVWLNIALMYTGHFHPFKYWKLLPIYVIPSITMILRITNSLHYIYYTSVSFVTVNDTLVMVKERGLWNYIQSFHSLAMTLLALGVFIYTAIKHKKTQQKTIYFLLIANAFTCIGLIMTLLNVGDLNISYLVMSMPITLLFVIYAIVKDDFLEIITLARDMVFEHSDIGIVLIDRNYTIIDVNQYAQDFFSKVGLNLQKTDLRYQLSDHPQLSGAFLSSEFRTYTMNQGEKESFYEISTELLDGKNNTQGYVKLIRDITENHLLQTSLVHQASTDHLSSLYNRRHFINSCRRQLRYLPATTNISMLMIDIDHFKSINDTYGHQAGDQVIRYMGDQLSSSFSKTDIIGRLGGEEFAVFFDCCEQDSILNYAEVFRKTVEETTIAYKGSNMRITVSIGLYSTNNHDVDLDILLTNADKALYKAKHSGRNQTKIS